MKIEQGTLAELNVKPGDVVDCITVDSGEEYDGINPHYIRDGRYGVAAYDDGGAYFMMGSPSIFRIVSRASDTPTAWKDMTDAEKGALLLAEHRGGDVEYWSGYAWNRHSKSMPLWCDGIAYRIKPAPVVETKEHTWNWAYGFFGYDGPDDPKTTHRITFDTVDGVPDCSTVKMEKL